MSRFSKVPPILLSLSTHWGMRELWLLYFEKQTTFVRYITVQISVEISIFPYDILRDHSMSFNPHILVIVAYQILTLQHATPTFTPGASPSQPWMLTVNPFG